MQSVFNVTSIGGDYSNKTITIVTNFTVDETTVNKKNVKVVDADSGTIVIYKLSTDKNNIIITLKEWPNLNSQYQVNVTEIKDKLGRDLINPLTKLIEFKADTKLKAEIVYPRNNEAVIRQQNLVYFSIRQLNPDATITVNPRPDLIDIIELPNDIINLGLEDSKKAMIETESDIKYHFEFASDVAFFNVVKEYYSNDYTDGIIELENNQYYMRVRIIEDGMPGDWSETITFTVISEPTGCDDILSEAQKQYLDEILSPVDFFLDEAEEIRIVSRSANGETCSEFFIEFNVDLDKESLSERIIAYRRNL